MREITMGHSEYDPAARERRAWNAGRIVGAKRALKPRQVWAIRFWLDHERRLRDRALFDLAIDSKLRGCDVVKVRIGDIVCGGRVRTRAIVVQQKTGRPVQFELLEAARTSILAWLEQRGGTLDDYAFPSRIDHTTHMSTRQYARLVDEWVTGIGLDPEDYGTHSLRRTKASIIYKATGNLRAVQLLLGHTKIESTVRCLGVDVEDALNLAESTDVLKLSRLNLGGDAGSIDNPAPTTVDPGQRGGPRKRAVCRRGAFGPRPRHRNIVNRPPHRRGIGALPKSNASGKLDLANVAVRRVT
jgi:integrase